MATDPLTEMLVAYQPLLTNFFQNFSDIGAKKSYRESIDELKGLQGERDNYYKFQNMSQKLVNTPLDVTDKYNQSIGWDRDYISGRDPKEIQGTESFKRYDEYAKTIEQQKLDAETAGTPFEGTVKPFDEWAVTDNDAMNEMYNLGYLTTINSEKPKEEVDKTRFTKAGFTEADQSFYNDYDKKNFNYEKYNRDILDMFYQNSPDMVSTGSLGNSLAEIYGKTASGYMITPPTPQKYNVHFEDGFMIKYDEQGNLIAKTFVGDANKGKKENPDDWIVDKDEAGELWKYANVYNEKTKKWELVKRRPLSGEEAKIYNLAMEKKEKKPTGRKRSSSGTKKYAPMEKFAYSAIKKLSDIGLTYSTIPFDRWDETTEGRKAKEEYQSLASALEKQFNLSGDDIHRIVGEYEATGKVDIDMGDLRDEGEEDMDNYEYIDDAFDTKDLSNDELISILKQITGSDIDEEEKDYARKKYLEKVVPDDEAIPYARTKKRK